MLNTEVGKIYDSIYFCIEYFNKSEIEKPVQSIYFNTKFMFDCYDEIHLQIRSLPPILEPFFYYRDQIPTVVSCFFTKNIDFHTTTFNDFIITIQNNVHELYQETIQSIFRPLEKVDSQIFLPSVAPAAYVNAINQLDLPLEYKLQISLLLGNFNFGVSQLIDTLKFVFRCVDSLHRKYSGKLSQEYANILNNNKVGLYHQFAKFDESVKVETVSISLLNQYIIYYKKQGNQASFLVGLNHSDSLSENLTDEQTSAENFLITCGNETRIAIIRSLTQNCELTTSQISKMMGCPVTTLIKHIEVLHSNNVIHISRRSGLQIFYKLNHSYFKQTRTNMEKMFHKILTQKEKKT